MQTWVLVTVVAVFFGLGGYWLARRSSAVLQTRQDQARHAGRSIDAITEERDQLAGVLAGLTVGVVALDPARRIVHINQAARVMLGLEQIEVAGKAFSELPIAREINQAVCMAEGGSLETRLGARIVNCSLVLTPPAEVATASKRDQTGAILVLENVTEKIHLEGVRSDFVANASHELKTPISAVRGLVETIIDDPEMPRDVRSRFIERIRQQTLRLDAIVQDLLQLSRFESAERAPAWSRIELTELLRQVFDSKRNDAADAGVELALTLPDGEQTNRLQVEGEAEALHQMVTNLVDNALKYTPGGGRVQLGLKRVGAMAQIAVEDNGIGIPATDTERIFERFYRVDQARSRGGTGLGLAIVKHIAQAHHGSIRLDTALGKGSTFSVQIPFLPKAKMGRKASPRPDMPLLDLSDNSLDSRVHK